MIDVLPALYIIEQRAGFFLPIALTTSRLFTAILFVALFTMTVREISDPDFWWHLRAGQYMAESRVIPHTDPFTFTAQGKEWVTHEWLAEVLFYAGFRAGSFALLTLVFSGVITLALALAYARSAGRPFIAGFAVLLGALATAPTWGVRPQMLSFLLLSVFLYLLDAYTRRRDWKWLAPLPLLMLLWANLHSGYAVGILAIGAYFAAAVIEKWIGSYRRGRGAAADTLPPPADNTRAPLPPPLPITALGAVLLASLLAVLLNPNGARLYTYPFETLTSPAMQRYIQEWFAPDLHQVEWLPFALLLVGTLAAALIARARVSLAEALLLFVLGLAALRSARNVPLFALVAVPVLAAQVAALLPLLASKASAPRALRAVNLIVLGLVVVVAAVRIAAVLGNQTNVERGRFPAAAVEWMQAHHPPANLYNSYGWGGYVIAKLYPELPAYIDGRADVHGDAFIERFLEIYRAEPGWREKLAQDGVRTVLLEPDAPLARALGEEADWTPVFADAESVVFVQK